MKSLRFCCFLLLILGLIQVSLAQKVSKLTFSPTSVVGGANATGTVTLSAKASSGGVNVSLASNNAAVITPATVTVPSGSTSTTFTVTAVPVPKKIAASVTASVSTSKLSTFVTVNPPLVQIVSLSSTSVLGGGSVTGTVTLASPSPGSSMPIYMVAPGLTITPSVITIPAGQTTSGTFTVQTVPVTKETQILVAAYNGTTWSRAGIDVEPPTVQSLTLAQPNLIAFTSGTGTVTLNGAAPSTGARITLSSSSNLVTLPAAVVVPAGKTQATFTMTAKFIPNDLTAKITAKYNASSITDNLYLVPLEIVSFAITPSSVQGGNTATGHVVTNAKVPTGGYPIKLSSDQSAVKVPSSYVQGTGYSDSTFTIQTSKVTQTTTATITVTGFMKEAFTATLVVGPVANGLSTGPWPKFLHDNSNTALGGGAGAVGSVNWTFATGAGVESAPAIGGANVAYFGSNDGYVHAVDLATGKSKWDLNIQAMVDAPPTVGADETVYVGAWDGAMYAIDGTTGKKKWFYPTNSYIMSGAALGKNNILYFGSADHNVYAVDAATGTLKWSYTTGAEVVSTPSIGSDGTVYIGSNDQKLYAFDGTTGAVKWTFATNGSIVSSPSIGADGTVYVTSYDQNLYAVDPSTGAQKWKFAAAGYLDSSPAIGPNGSIYFGSENHTIYAVDSSGNALWTYDMGSIVSSTPAIASDGTLYVGGIGGFLVALNGSTGKSVWSVNLNGRINCSPAIGSDGKIYIGSDDKHLYSIK